MSRETYQPPALASGSGSNTSPTNTNTYSNPQATSIFGQAANYEETARPTQYLCGECDTKVVLKKGDAIRCKECGYRVLYKERTNRMIQFEAR